MLIRSGSECRLEVPNLFDQSIEAASKLLDLGADGGELCRPGGSCGRGDQLGAGGRGPRRTLVIFACNGRRRERLTHLFKLLGG
jgi:hypothetical protein